MTAAAVGHMQVLSVLIIGGGATGSVLASTLGALSSTSALWEKSTSTGRVSHSTARGAASGGIADLGAQYFTMGRATRGEGDLRLKELCTAGILVPMSCSIAGEAPRHAGFANFVAPNGAGSVIRFYRDRAAAAGVACHESTRLATLDTVKDPSPDTPFDAPLLWRAESECGRVALSRRVVLTVPAPQLPALRGVKYQAALTAPSVALALQGVTYDTRLALAVYFSPSDMPKMDLLCPWSARFVDGDAIVRFVSYETRKRTAGVLPASNATATAPAPAPTTAPAPAPATATATATATAPAITPCLVVHSTATYGATHETTPDVARVVESDMLTATFKALAACAGVDPSTLPTPIETRVHRWRYGQVTKRANIPLSQAALVISNSPTLILAGDYLSVSSNFSGACESAADALAAFAGNEAT